ncbi:ester cyclase [Lutimonas vermicola]|uniref:Ester cyclase n=1 Tax=Lutimonas vermicola TaxID=414288 RepID=A0ABU9L1A7_9FLAO
MSKQYRIAFFFLLLLGCSNTAYQEEKESQHKKTVLDFIDTVWNKKDLNSLDLFFSSEFTRKVNDIEVATENADLTANINVLFIAFPDLKLSVESIVAAENTVFVNWNIKATNTGVFGDNEATGKKIIISGLSRIDLNEESKIIYENVFYNELSLLQQLGYRLLKPNTE